MDYIVIIVYLCGDFLFNQQIGHRKIKEATYIYVKRHLGNIMYVHRATSVTFFISLTIITNRSEVDHIIIFATQ